MIKSLPCYTLICDSCGVDLYKDADYSGFGAVDFVLEEAESSEWNLSEDAQYCPDCYSFDDDDNLVIKNTKQ